MCSLPSLDKLNPLNVLSGIRDLVRGPQFGRPASAPPPPPPAPTDTTERAEAAENDERRRALLSRTTRRGGQASTIRTGPGGIEDSLLSTSRKRRLGV